MHGCKRARSLSSAPAPESANVLSRDDHVAFGEWFYGHVLDPTYHARPGRPPQRHRPDGDARRSSDSEESLLPHGHPGSIEDPIVRVESLPITSNALR
jgi:hypothetical protein